MTALGVIASLVLVAQAQPVCPKGNVASARVSGFARWAETVVDARFGYRFDTANGGMDLYFNVNDLFDTEPEDFFTGVYSSNVAAGTGLNVTAGTLTDIVGIFEEVA